MTKPTKSFIKTLSARLLESICQSNFLFAICCSATMVSSAVPASFAQNSPPEPVKSAESSKPAGNDAPAVSSPDATKTSTTPSSTTPRPMSDAMPLPKSFYKPPMSTADDFIPGSEVLPTPEKTTAQSEEFVKSQKPTMDLAMVLYKNNEFKQSLLVLAKLPQTEQVHYYTGLCYKELGNFKDATTHFAWVAYYAKDPKLKSYAFAAIRSTKPNRLNIKKVPGTCESTIYSSAQAKIRSEELQHRIQMKEIGDARRREMSGGF